MTIIDLYIDAQQLVSTDIPGGTMLHIVNIPSGATLLAAEPCADGTYHVRYSVEDKPPAITKFKIGNLRIAAFRTNYGQGPNRWFLFDATRVWRNAVPITKCLRHPIQAYRGLFGDSHETR